MDKTQDKPPKTRSTAFKTPLKGIKNPSKNGEILIRIMSESKKTFKKVLQSVKQSAIIEQKTFMNATNKP